MGYEVFPAVIKNIERNPKKKKSNLNVVVEYEEAWPDGSATEEMLMREVVKADRDANQLLRSLAT